MLDLLSVQPRCDCLWMHTSTEERFICIDVSNAGHDSLVKQTSLGGLPA
jgi:hypothetical protein